MDLSESEKISLFKQEQLFLEPWYQWQDITGKVLDKEIKLETIVGSNRGFGTPDSLFFGLGKKLWNEKSETFPTENLKIFISKKIQFHKTLRFYKLVENSNKEIKLAFLPIISVKNSSNILARNSGFLINETNVPIYNSNEESVFWLKTEQEILDYVKFFFFNVEGRHGKFYIFYELARIAELLDFSQRELKDKKKYKKKDIVKEVEENMNEIQFLNLYNDNPKYVIKNVHMVFQGCIFKANIQVDKNDGQVKMFDEKLILGES